MNDIKDELVFVPLGGLGQIGMNAALYGYGPQGRKQWILVDLGLAFSGPTLPGVEILLPHIEFVESIKKNLLGLLITHAHEDHIGAIADLWPRLGCPVYATSFSIGLLETKHLSESNAPRIPFHKIQPGQVLELGPFSVEYIRVAHSIPESCALALKTPVGRVIHTGDWKIDDTPYAGWATDQARLRALGEEGVLALVCDSTNIMRAGQSPSETDVAESLIDLIRLAPHRVVVTTFASNVARIKAVVEAASVTGRRVVVVGRALDRVIGVARECGYLPASFPFYSGDIYTTLPRDQVIVLATGSQGEPRAALARIAKKDHPTIQLASGDRVIFSSRTIPGNERGVNEIINGLIDQGLEILTDRTHLVHVSGHPRRNEVEKMYEWVRPQLLIPAHGEPLHLSEQVSFARDCGIPQVMSVRNGNYIHLAPGEPRKVRNVPHGALCKDGQIIISASDESLLARQRLAFAGCISVGLAINAKGDVMGDPDVVFEGIPLKLPGGKTMDEIIDKALFDIIESLPRVKRRQCDVLASAIERAIRSVVHQIWGKKPVVHVVIIEV